MASVALAVKQCQVALGDSADLIRAELERGDCQAFRVGDTTVIVRQEEKTLVVVAVEGTGIRRVIRAIHSNGKRSGFSEWRVHVRDFRLARIIKRLIGWNGESRDASGYIIIYGSF